MTRKTTILKIYYGFIIAGAVLGGTISLFLTDLLDVGLSRFQVVFIRFGIATVLLGLYLLCLNPKLFRFHLRDFWMFIGTGILSMLFFNFCYFTCIEMVSVSVAAVLLYTAPIIVTLLSAVLFHEKLTGKKLIVVLMTFFGCVFVTGIHGGTDFPKLGILIGLMAGFGYAMYSIFSMVAVKKYNSITITFYTFLLATVGIMPFSEVQEIPGMIMNAGVIFNCFGVGFFTCLLPYLMYTRALTLVPASTASIMSTVEPVVATVIGVVVFQESVTPLNFFGILLILLGIALLNLPENRIKRIGFKK